MSEKAKPKSITNPGHENTGIARNTFYHFKLA